MTLKTCIDKDGRPGLRWADGECHGYDLDNPDGRQEAKTAALNDRPPERVALAEKLAAAKGIEKEESAEPETPDED